MKNLKQFSPSMFLFFALLFGAWSSQAQVINFPSDNFKNLLLNNSQINTNGDNEIQLTEAANFTGSLNVSNASIQDLTGLEHFTEITSLNCSGNGLMYLNVERNTKLLRLNCSNNKIFNLDLSTLSNLLILNVSSNLLHNLDLNHNIELIQLYCQHNQLTQLEIGNNTNLIKVNCGYNDLIELNFSLNTNIDNIDCSNNMLEFLNAANGNNSAMTAADFKANNNNLNCIKVDDENYAITYWTGSIDAQSYFSESCTALPVEEVSETEFTLFPNPSNDGTVTVYFGGVFERVSVEVYNTSGGVVMKNSYNNKEAVNLDLGVTSGVYMLTVNTGSGSNFTKKLIVR